MTSRERSIARPLMVSVLLAAGALVFVLLRDEEFLTPTMRMRIALGVKRHADAQEKVWSSIAARAATAYHRARP